jgi:hypothetical protein
MERLGGDIRDWACMRPCGALVFVEGRIRAKSRFRITALHCAGLLRVLLCCDTWYADGIWGLVAVRSAESGLVLQLEELGTGG